MMKTGGFYMDNETIDYKAIVNNSPVVSYIILNDEHFTIRFMSKAIENLSGHPQESFQSGTFFRELIEPEDNDQNARVVEDVIRKKEESFILQYRLRHRSGRRIWVKEHGKVVYDETGEVKYFTGMMWNESDIKQAETELKSREDLISAILQATEVLFSQENYAHALEQCFCILGEVNRVHRIYLYENAIHGEHAVTSLKYEWVSEGVSAHIDDPQQQDIPLATMSEFFDPLHRGEAFECIVDELENVELKAHLRAQDIQSIVVLPLFVKRAFYGFIGFDDTKAKRRFTLLERQLLMSFSKSVETAIERHSTLEAVQEQSSVLETVFQAIEDGVALIDRDMKVVLANEGMKKYSKAIFEKGIDCGMLCNEDMTDCYRNLVSKALKDGRPQKLEKAIRLNGEQRYIETLAYPVREGLGKVTKVVQIVRDITERKTFEEKLKMLSETDVLTSLGNRAFFDQKMKMLDQEADYHVYSLDVDGLKIINDTFGHDRGDTLLITVAELLKKVTPSEATLARIGGDEFALLVEDLSEEDAHRLNDEILEVFEDYNMRHETRYLSVSLGMARSQVDQSPFDVLRQADEDMYSQKLHKGQSAKSQIIKTLLATLKTRDYSTKTHGTRMIEHVTRLAKELGLPSSRITHMKTLAEVHDIGKIGIPDAILLKPSELTPKEWKLMKTHPEKGYRIALNSPELAAISEYILKHHEHYDGSGYPLGIKAEDIPIESRILLVCDAYDAMISDRHYRQAMSADEAIAELLEHRGRQFDPNIVEVFIRDVLKKPDRVC